MLWYEPNGLNSLIEQKKKKHTHQNISWIETIEFDEQLNLVKKIMNIGL